MTTKKRLSFKGLHDVAQKYKGRRDIIRLFSQVLNKKAPEKAVQDTW